MTLLILSNCVEPISLSFSNPPAGKGSFSLIVSNSGRSIMPDSYSIMSYEMDFFLAGTTTLVDSFIRNASGVSDPVYLTEGAYDLEVTAYADTARLLPVARGNSSNIIIDAGSVITRTVDLTAYGIVTGQKGIFKWDIGFLNNLLNNLTEASLKIETLAGIDIETYYFKNAPTSAQEILPSDFLELDCGEYIVTFILVKDNNHRSVVWMETLYIYQNMESYFEINFNENNFNSISYTVTFINNNGTGNGTQTRLHGQTASALSPAPVRTGFDFDNWYADSGLNNIWNFNTQLSGNITLYAGWLGNLNSAVITVTNTNTFTGSPLTPTFTVTHDGNTLIAGTDFTASYSNNTNVGTATITITAVTGSRYTGTGTQTFTIGKAAVGSAVSGVPTVDGTPTHDTIIINPVTIPLNPGGQNVEYAISTENNADPSTLTWQDGTMFTGLTRDTTYYVYTRSAENSNYNAGVVQVSAGIKTDEKERITDTADILDFIDRQQSAGTIDDPITLPFRLQLTETNWLEILEAIQTSGKFVDVDLGDTTRSTSATGGGLRSNGTFDPMSANNTGKGHIVNIDLPDASTSVQGGTWENPTFNHFDSLKSVSGNELASVGVYAFRDCSNLEDIYFPNVTTINSGAFDDCISLVNVHFPRVTLIDGFSRCINLESVTFPLATSINFFAFSDCTSLIDVDIPNVTIIGTGAFQNCTSLENVQFQQLATILNSAFAGCTSLISVNIPNVNYIELNAFENTGTHVLTIIMGSNAPNLSSNIFSNITRTVNVLVPSTASGYGSIPGVHNSLDNTAENWGNGLRGRGWWEGAIQNGTIRNGITVNVNYE